MASPNAPSESATKVKRPMNAFMLWARTERRRLRKTMARMPNSELSCVLGGKWRKLTEAEKDVYRREAERLRHQHSLEHPDYRYVSVRRARKKEVSPLSFSQDSPENEASALGHGPTSSRIIADRRTSELERHTLARGDSSPFSSGAESPVETFSQTPFSERRREGFALQQRTSFDGNTDFATGCHMQQLSHRTCLHQQTLERQSSPGGYRKGSTFDEDENDPTSHQEGDSPTQLIATDSCKHEDDSDEFWLSLLEMALQDTSEVRHLEKSASVDSSLGATSHSLGSSARLNTAEISQFHSSAVTSTFDHPTSITAIPNVQPQYSTMVEACPIFSQTSDYVSSASGPTLMTSSSVSLPNSYQFVSSTESAYAHGSPQLSHTPLQWPGHIVASGQMAASCHSNTGHRRSHSVGVSPNTAASFNTVPLSHQQMHASGEPFCGSDSSHPIETRLQTSSLPLAPVTATGLEHTPSPAAMTLGHLEASANPNKTSNIECGVWMDTPDLSTNTTSLQNSFPPCPSQRIYQNLQSGDSTAPYRSMSCPTLDLIHDS